MFYKKLKNTEVNVNLMAVTSVENYEFINDVVKIKNQVHTTLLDYVPQNVQKTLDTFWSAKFWILYVHLYCLLIEKL